MRALLLSIVVAAAAACGGTSNPSLCDQNPAPAECAATCDPTPGAANTCAAGFHCGGDGHCTAECTQGGSECGTGRHCTPDGRCLDDGACVGLGCDIVDCGALGMPPTTISGRVFAPNGTLPLYGVNVYVPNAALPPTTDGAVCDRCNDNLPGSPVVQIATDENGDFTLTDVPVGTNIPLVISIGKWRRTLTIPTVAQCTDNPLTAVETRLPKNRSEGDLPKIAISTGSADALECLVRKLGIDDAEMGTDGAAARIHLYADSGAGGGQGANSFRNGFPGGSGTFANSTTLWNTVDKLRGYDIVILSCEGGQHPETKPQAAMDALKAYADLGGRVFLSHWHNIWIEGSTRGGGTQAPAVWSGPNGVATWNDSGPNFNTPPDTIDEVNNPKGSSFATWMLNVGGSPARDVIPIEAGTGRNTCEAVDNSKAERWVYWENGGNQFPQMFQFTTPNEGAVSERCGKVVFSDMHVSGDSDSRSGTPFPNDCATSDLTPQEKALAFMFFDIASCVGPPIGKAAPAAGDSATSASSL
ncbi:MAG: carboxypeptidase regulatory-like domain-containing protein [Myxococcales bacterium]|nr:carboxypeptidase regulatory-like domain-containing protein [Myxococcales bacterium]